MQTLLIVGLGGMLGALLRYGSVTAIDRFAGGAMPWGTLFVNVVGSMALGALLVLAERMAVGAAMRRFAAVGVLGAFTTFSSFSWELFAMLRSGEWLRAMSYAGFSVVLGVAALAAGAGMTTFFVADA